MDRLSQDSVIEPLTPETPVEDAFTLSTNEIGTTTNPMGNALQSLNSRVREGAGRIEFEFVGQGKGSSQQPTPESYGNKERQDMKELLTINDIESSVHAAVHGNSLAGAGQRGFTGAQRQQAVQEINRAIDFAGDVTSGGAVVFHVSEWQRPMTHAGEDPLERTEGTWMFKGYDTEEEDSQMLVVDKRTGKYIDGITKDTKVYEPVYLTAKDRPGLVGQRDDKGALIADDDWIDINGNVISKDAGVKELFERVPKYNDENTNFEIVERDWNHFVDKAQEWNEHHPDEQRTAEEMFAMTKLENSVLQAKGNSLYHAMRYKSHQSNYKKLKEAYEFYEKYEDSLPPEELEALKEKKKISDWTIPYNKLPPHVQVTNIKSCPNMIVSKFFCFFLVGCLFLIE